MPANPQSLKRGQKMPNSYSKELLADIHIRLDQEGLNSLTEKEVSVLLSEAISTSATFIVDRLTTHIDAQTEQLIAHMDIQTKQLMRHSEAQTDRIIQELHFIRGGITDLREDMAHIRKDLEQSRFWTKVTSIGLWAVAAGLIANLIFEMLANG